MLKFKVTYLFTSTKADGEEYRRTRLMDAASSFDLTDDLIRAEGFREFGARFTDNCTDWTVDPVWEPTESFLYRMPHVDGDDHDEVRVDVSDTKEGLAWRLVVNGRASDWGARGAGLVEHEGYFVATAYCSVPLEEMRPFRATYAERVQS